MIIAIDGPAGTGKGTIAKIISEKFDVVNVDTGAMYRAVTIEVLKENININNDEEITKLLENIDIKLENKNGEQKVFLNGENVTGKIRTKEISGFVSEVSAIKKIRLKMVDLQRKMAKNQSVVMEGRDIGTYVFPNADVKIYLDADATERANRRLLQNKEKGIEMSYDEILNNIMKRDEIDKNKEMGALKKADDAIYIDTTHLSIEEVANKVEDIIRKRKENV